MEKQSNPVMALLKEVKKLAKDYRTLTGKPLGVTGEVAEYEAARILGLELEHARKEGYDATERVDEITRKLQIKGRCLQPDSKRGQQLGSIDPKKDWDAVLMVLLDEDLEATEIWEADRERVVGELRRPGSKARTERGALRVNKFKKIGKSRWRRSSPE